MVDRHRRRQPGRRYRGHGDLLRCRHGGYLVVSDQGINSFAVYRREGDNAYLGQFRVVADASAGIDGVSETDGIDVTSADLGPAFPHGVFIAQDGRNIAPTERQNFKLVPWQRIAAAKGGTPDSTRSFHGRTTPTFLARHSGKHSAEGFHEIRRQGIYTSLRVSATFPG